MTAETLFYILGSVLFATWIVLLIAIIVGVILIVRKVSNLSKDVHAKIIRLEAQVHKATHPFKEFTDKMPGNSGKMMMGLVPMIPVVVKAIRFFRKSK